MPSGGARAKSGPPADPNSLNSAKRGVVLATLPVAGFQGDPPDFPLPSPSGRELELWGWAWSTPQAAAWAVAPWRWWSVAMWVRTAVVCEAEGASAADKNSLHRFAEDIGLTPAGLARNGWSIAADELAGRREGAPRESARDRLRALNGG